MLWSLATHKIETLKAIVCAANIVASVDAPWNDAVLLAILT